MHHVLIKCGYLHGETSDDCLYLGLSGETVLLPDKRLLTQKKHGIGCTLSSAIAANIAKGNYIASAVHLAKEYIVEAILSALKVCPVAARLSRASAGG